MARGERNPQVSMLALVDPEVRIPATHPLRAIKRFAEVALADLSSLFDQMYSEIGRPSIPPERLLKGQLVMVLYSIRSERLLCEELHYNQLYRWFLGMDTMEEVFDPSTFTKNRERLLKHAVAEAFFAAVVRQANARQLLSDEHFTVDGTLIEAAASHKSFRPRVPVAGVSAPANPVTAPAAVVAMPDDPGNSTVNFRGEQRSNATHISTTDPEAMLAKKSAGKEAKLSYAAHALMENPGALWARLLVDLQVSTATGTAERDAVPVLLDRARAKGFHPKTLGADKGYDTKACVAAIRAHGVTPHVAQNAHSRRSSAVDDETVRQPGYTISQRKRKLVEEGFGWGKTIGGLRRTRFVGLAKTQLAVYLIGAAYNLVRMGTLTRVRIA